MRHLHALLSLLLTGASMLNAAEVFRTELFPEQLEQQQIQFQQISLQQQIQNLQRLVQVATTTDERQDLQRRQNGIDSQMRQMQRRLLTLQQKIQERLGGGVAFVTQPDIDLQSEGDGVEVRILNRLDNPPVAGVPDERQQQFQQQQPNFQQQQPNFQQQRPTFQQQQPNFQQQQPNFQQQQPNSQQQQPNFQQQQPNFQQQQPNFQQQQPNFQQQQPNFQQQQPNFQQQRPTTQFQQPQTPTQPPSSDEAIIPCSTLSGEAGNCRPLIKCLSFYAELPELKKQPCQLGEGGLGVCCPRRSRPTGGPSKNSGVLHAPPPPPVVIPPFTPQQLDHAAQTALQRIQERVNFIIQLFNNRVVVKPGSPAAAHQEFFPVTNATLQRGETAQKNVEASVDLVQEFNLSPDQGKFALPTFSVLNTVIADSCPRPSSCVAGKYRSADGSCNNLRHDQWGRGGVALQRILPPKYDDGVNAPRSQTSNGQELPSARLVSTSVAQDKDDPSGNYTLMVMQWGQFLDHDLTHTPINFGQSGAGISCCREGVPLEPSLRHPDCFHIDLPRTDKIFSPFGERCMEFVRSLPAPRPECNFGPREQMNQITGYLDGSNIYGSTIDAQRSLREFRGGRLRVQNLGRKGMLPANSNECQSPDQRRSCFLAGDGRVNEQVNLALTHTVWMREHNRVAAELARLHPDWSDEALFQETRRIVVAEIQHITYNEFLPIILGRTYMDKFQLSPKESGWTKLYDPELNGGITNVFATAAFRFGHSLIQGHMHGYGKFGNIRENLQLSKQHFIPFVLYNEGAVDDMIRGLASQSAQKFDRFFTNEVTDHLFQGDLDLGLDLFALNIQRGRDHGLPPYNDWREVCGMPKARSWQDLVDVMDPQSINRLAAVYPSVDEVDLFAGAVAERPVEGAMLGPTFVCLVGDQFSRLRRGDRFFYEEANQPSSFTQAQLEQLRKASLARILCDNSDNIALIQPLAFVQPSFLNQRVACSSDVEVPRVELHPWTQERPAV
ncbi:peroxidase-like [Macrosteles quadrilineatus]|uniref:peroxidase-like n=1 Tax=Macrosteles quadrilineatus TaxID=74068 RepID=UPI0023E0C9FA|nr:peroxidase-like [Macrosteles quadrilineatus]